jgi:hypothetical protein
MLGIINNNERNWDFEPNALLPSVETLRVYLLRAAMERHGWADACMARITLGGLALIASCIADEPIRGERTSKSGGNGRI